MIRRILLLIVLVTIPLYLHAQIVTTEPAFPAVDEPVTIYFDATEGTGGLANYDGDIYAHTGVLTEESQNNSDWKYVVADWGENIPKIKMERVEPNLYKLEITPGVREYYGVPEDEKITHMAFVFRNSDGSLEGKADGGEDIFVKVYDSSFNVKFSEPQKDLVFRKQSESLTIVGVGSSDSTNMDLSLFIDGNPVKQVSNDTIRYTYNATAEGKFEIALAGTDGAENDTVYTTLVVYPEQTDQDRPVGLEDGITYVDDSTVKLSLFAPYKEFVYLIGDFNNWQVQPEYLMKRDSVNADSVYFWTEINGLAPGTEYAFQYLVDGEIRIADPYSEKILDPYNDQYIPESIYPNLKAYPQDKTEYIVGVLQPGKDPYNWQTTDYDRPEKENLVVYELLIRDFIKDHDFETLIDTLDYLDRLGVNAIELMPIMEFNANSSWGYNPTFLFAVDKYYGPAEDLKKFIDECHSRDIAVILDMVLNHAWGPSPFVRLWNDGDYGKPTTENPYLNREPKHDYNVGYDFNHESSATKYLVDRVTEYWLKEFHFDGFRFDLSKGFTQNNTLGDVAAWGEYDASRVRLLKRMADQLWTVDDSAYVILEHLAVNEEEKELANYGMLLWGNMHYNYNEATMGFHDNGKSDFSWIYYKNRGWNNPHVLGYMESHDEQRLMYKNLRYGNSSMDGSYDITRLSTALNRIKLAGAFFFTIPGPKMIWQFGELGYGVDINENGRTGEKPIKWEYYSNTSRKRLYKTFKALIRLRKSHPVFTSEVSNLTMDLNEAIKRIVIDHPDMDVSIVGNFGVTEKEVTPSFTQNGKWYTFFSGDSLTVSNVDTSFTLAPGKFRIFTTQKFKAPEANILSGEVNEENKGDKILTFRLYQNYPNPFTQSTSIPYQLARPATVSLKVFNILGQVVTSREIGEKTAGSYEIEFDVSGLSSGVYLYRVKAGDDVAVKKMMLIK
ncbi:MAG TPA: alpha-amylase family glycosyl hydrolase [Balneolaceae bacterium]